MNLPQQQQQQQQSNTANKSYNPFAPSATSQPVSNPFHVDYSATNSKPSQAINTLPASLEELLNELDNSNNNNSNSTSTSSTNASNSSGNTNLESDLVIIDLSQVPTSNISSSNNNNNNNTQSLIQSVLPPLEQFVRRYPMRAESAIMNPGIDKVLAVKGNDHS